MTLTCTPKRLPDHLLIPAAAAAIEHNPVNAPAPGLVLPPQHIAMLTSKYWGPASRTLSVQFLDGGSATLRARILQHMNAWSKFGAGISFAYTAGTGTVRIVRQPDGYWSYVGTDITQIPPEEPTMCLEAFSTGTPESEYRRVVRHETGHTLGFVHEHMRRELVSLIDPAKAYAWFARYQGWDRQTVDDQVLTPLDQGSIMGTPVDQVSVMTYQLPGSITKTGAPILGGNDIDISDQQFAAKVYPKARR